MKKFEIVMLGNTSVGKTSMLAVMSKEIQKANSACAVSFAPCGDTVLELDDAWGELLGQIEEGKLYKPVHSSLLGTQDFVTYHFDLKVKGATRAKVDFVDTKGGFIRNIEGSGLLERTQNALGVFCVVDASVLMECDGKTNYQYNRPGLVHDLLKKVFDAPGRRPMFVAFVMTKCETYMRSEEGKARLKERFHEVYGTTVNNLRDKQVNSYALAVETLGCVKFKSLVETPWDSDKPLKLPQFVKVGTGRMPESRGCEVPLIVAMKNLIWAIHDGKGFWEGFLEWFGLGDNLPQYVKQLERIMDEAGGAAYYEELFSNRKK